MTLALGEVTIGHVLDVLATWPAASVHCVVTSPPYWGLRAYSGEQACVWGGDAGCEHAWAETAPRRSRRHDDAGSAKQASVRGSCYDATGGRVCSRCGAWRGGYGLEPLHDCGRPEGKLCSVCYVCHTLMILRAIRRVLRPNGVLWWNLGDSYAGSGGAHANEVNPGLSQSFRRFGGAGDIIGSDGYERRNRNERGRAGPSPGLKPGDLCMIPQRVALAAQADGWFVRSEVIWHKPSCMPESISGWSWQQHQVKVEREESADCLGCMKCANPISLPTPGGIITGRVGHRVPTGRTETIWQDCPGCPKCTPNDGLVLRRGSWRPTTAHEKVLLLAASQNYWADGEDVREGISAASVERYRTPMAAGKNEQLREQGIRTRRPGMWDADALTGGRNLRTVWQFPTMGYAGAHFAVFPPALPTRCILAGCPPRVCRECGAPWARVVERVRGIVHDNTPDEKYAEHCRKASLGQSAGTSRPLSKIFEQALSTRCRTAGWRRTCSCGVTEWLAGIVLDPFAGSGTTLKVAQDLGRRWAGIEICEQYLELIRQRLGQVTELPEGEGAEMVLPLGVR